MKEEIINKEREPAMMSNPIAKAITLTHSLMALHSPSMQFNP